MIWVALVLVLLLGIRIWQQQREIARLTAAVKALMHAPKISASTDRIKVHEPNQRVRPMGVS